MSYNTISNDSPIANITRALPLLSDEKILANGGTWKEFEAEAAKRWANAPLGDDSSPESCRTVATSRVAA